MNDTHPTGPLIPPPIPPPPPPGYPSGRPLGELPEEREPIPNAVAAVEAILRQPRRVMYQLRQPGSGGLIAGMLFVAVLGSVVSGVVVGIVSGRVPLWPARLQIAGGLVVSALILLP